MGLSLDAFARAKRREGCPVCALPDDTRLQILGASERGIRRPTVLAWLRDEIKAEIRDTDLTTHVNGHHDAREP